MPRIVSILLFVLFFLFAPNFRVHASYTFIEEFSSLPLDNWTVLNEGSAELLSDSAYLYIHDSTRYQSIFVESMPQLFHSDNVEVEIVFKYLPGYYNFGTGIAVNDSQVQTRIADQHPEEAERVIDVWPGIGFFNVESFVCLENAGEECDSVPVTLKTVSGSDFYEWHTLRIRHENSRYEVFFDGELIGITIQTSRNLKNLWFGNPMTTGSVNYSEFLVDRVEIVHLDEDHQEEPSFPYYSQLNPEWAGEEYDEASGWAPEGEIGIDRWGCALTSAAMIFKNFGVNHPVTSEESNPQVLNNWLNERPDGYIRNGLVNWIALTKYAKESKSTGNSPTTLEFKKDKNVDVNSVDLPTILGLPGHFVVAHDEDIDNFDINDPVDKSNITLSKSSDIASTNTYTQSDTDLSYMMFVVNQEVDIVLFDSDNNPGGGIFLEDPILDVVDGEGHSGETLKTLLFPKPDDGVYTLRVSNPGSETQDYELDLYLYDSEGEVIVETFEISTPGEFEELYEINFNKNSVDDSSAEYTIPSLKDLLWEYYDLGEIKNKGTAQSIDNFFKYAERFAEKFPWFQDRVLGFARKYILRHTPDLISEIASDELIARIDLFLD